MNNFLKMYFWTEMAPVPNPCIVSNKENRARIHYQARVLTRGEPSHKPHDLKGPVGLGGRGVFPLLRLLARCRATEAMGKKQVFFP